MDYTLSNSYATHAGTGQRMHEENQAIPTQVSEKDMNSLIWGAMEVVKAAGLVGVQFNEATPATYQVFVKALKRLAGGNIKTVVAVGVTTLTADDDGLVLVDATAGNITINLPLANASLSTQRFEFYRTDNTANTITVQRSGADVMAPFTLTGAGDMRTISSNANTVWVTTSATVQSIKPLINSLMVSPATASGVFTSSGSVTASLTAPCAGYVVAMGTINESSTLNYIAQLVINGTVAATDTTTMSQAHTGFAAVTAGQVCTAQTLISAVAGVSFGLRATLFFIPKP